MSFKNRTFPLFSLNLFGFISIYLIITSSTHGVTTRVEITFNNFCYNVIYECHQIPLLNNSEHHEDNNSINNNNKQNERTNKRNKTFIKQLTIVKIQFINVEMCYLINWLRWSFIFMFMFLFIFCESFENIQPQNHQNVILLRLGP